MQTRALGRAGPQVSVLGLGCNNFGSRIGPAESVAVVDRAIDLGVTLFDVADIYGSPSGAFEEILGQALGARRKSVVLATKFGGDMGSGSRNASRAYVMSAAEASLRRLRTDYIDLYQLHFPDGVTPIDETLRALADLIDQGKVKYIGCSNLPAAAVREAQATARAIGVSGYVCSQDEYSLVVRDAEAELIPALLDEGMGLLPYFPLASGLLTGKYRRGAAPGAGTRFAAWRGLGDRYMTAANLDLVERLETFARAQDMALLDLAFAWLLAHPPVASVIAGATSARQVEANAAAAARTLTADQLAAVDAICAGRAV